MKSRDLNLVMDVWSAPSPSDGFADRVMAACLAPPVVLPRRRARGGILAVAALVAATIAVPLFVSHSAPPQQMAVISDLDLGSQPD